MPDQLNAFSSASDMLDALNTRQISAVELLDVHLRRIEQHNPSLNAIVTLDVDRARQAAKTADEARSQGDQSPLLGLPLTIKDCIYVKDLPTTGGVADRAKAISTKDAAVAGRVRTAGGTIMGKTNVPPYASDWQSDNPLFGRSNNPWDLSRTPGGSTGGGAAAVAAGLSPLEFGGDFGGSIRIPAAFCGIYGHKPSETLVPRSGHFPGPNQPTNAAVAMAVQGPLARDARDLELGLDVIAGADTGEDVAWRIDLPPARHERLKDFRVAVMPSVDWTPVDDEIMRALDKLAAKLGKHGVQVEVVQPLPNFREYVECYLSIFWAISSTGMPEEDRRQWAEGLRQGWPFGEAEARGLLASASDYIMWFGQREQYRSIFRSFFRDWDVLLTPTNVVNAFPHMDAPIEARTLDINGKAERYSYQFIYPTLCNLSGQPGTAFPAGLTQDGLPIGLQAVGPYLEDRTSIRFAKLVAQEFDGFTPPPGYATM